MSNCKTCCPSAQKRSPAASSCSPCVKVEKNDCTSKLMTSQELQSLPQCSDSCKPQHREPQFVKIKQPPRTICQKKIVYSKRTVIEKHVVPETREICEPRLVYQPKVICEPVVVYKKRIVHEPKIVYVKRCVPDPKIVCESRTLVEPKEICQTLVCQPMPQIMQIPEPQQYIVTPTETPFTFTSNRDHHCKPCNFESVKESDW